MQEIWISISTCKVELGTSTPFREWILQKQGEFSKEVPRSVAAVQKKALSGLHPTQYAIGTLAEFSDLGPQMELISQVWIWISI